MGVMKALKLDSFHPQDSPPPPPHEGGGGALLIPPNSIKL
jgi:hypothetical protein